jgi:hypothetical protein
MDGGNRYAPGKSQEPQIKCSDSANEQAQTEEVQALDDAPGKSGLHDVGDKPVAPDRRDKPDLKGLHDHSNTVRRV